MKRAALIVLLAAAVILQVSFLPALRPLGVVPNLVLIAMILAAQEVVTSEALMAAAGSGLLLDVASGSNFGLWTGVLMLTVLSVGLLRLSGFEADSVAVAVALTAVATLVLGLVIWLSEAPQALHWETGVVTGRLMVELIVNLILVLVCKVPAKWLLTGGRTQTSMGE